MERVWSLYLCYTVICAALGKNLDEVIKTVKFIKA